MYGRSTAAPQVRKIAAPTMTGVFFFFIFDFKLSTVDFFLHFSVGNPASFQPFHPPSIDSTFV
jgi:hypothetical protein